MGKVMTILASTANELAESGFIPDRLIRSGIRRLCATRRDEISGQVDAISKVRIRVLDRRDELVRWLESHDD